MIMGKKMKMDQIIDEIKLLMFPLLLYAILWLTIFFFFEIMYNHISSFEKIYPDILSRYQEGEASDILVNIGKEKFLDKYIINQMNISFLIQLLILVPLLFGTIYPSYNDSGFLLLVKSTGFSEKTLLLNKISLTTIWLVIVNFFGWVTFLIIDGLVLYSFNLELYLLFIIFTLLSLIPFFIFFISILFIVISLVYFISYFFSKTRFSIAIFLFCLLLEEVIVNNFFKLFIIKDFAVNSISLIGINGILWELNELGSSITTEFQLIIILMCIYLFFFIILIYSISFYFLNKKRRVPFKIDNENLVNKKLN